MLENVSLFEGLPAEILAKIESRAVPQSYRRSAVVITEGEDATSMFIIASGSVKVYHTEADGEETILNTLGAGQNFGELALVDDAPRSESFMTLEPSRLLMLSKAAFKDYLAESPEIAYHLLAQLAHQVQRLTETVNEMRQAAAIITKYRAVYEFVKGRSSRMKDPDT